MKTQFLRIEFQDLALAVRLAGFKSLGAFSKSMARMGGIGMSARTMAAWNAGENIPNAESWRIVEDFLAARGVTMDRIAAAKEVQA